MEMNKNGKGLSSEKVSIILGLSIYASYYDVLSESIKSERRSSLEVPLSTKTQKRMKQLSKRILR